MFTANGFDSRPRHLFPEGTSALGGVVVGVREWLALDSCKERKRRALRHESGVRPDLSLRSTSLFSQ
jgi:hypothetical protein